METDITKSTLYAEATDVNPTSLTSPVRVRQTLQEISNGLDDTIDRDSAQYAIHSLGKMYRNSLGKNTKSTHILSHLLNCYYELLQKELGYNNSIEKTEIIKKSMLTIHNTLDILEKLGYECDGERFKTLLRAFSI
jgi:hypothetical protein